MRRYEHVIWDWNGTLDSLATVELVLALALPVLLLSSLLQRLQA